MTAMTIAAGRTCAAPHRMFTSRRTGMLSCATAMAILGGSVPITQSLVNFPHMAGQALRYGIAAAALAPIAARGHRQRPPIRATDWARLAAVAACGLVGFNLCLLAALSHGDAAVVATILGCAPIALGIATPLLARQPPSRRILAAATFVVAGTVLLNGSGQLDAAGAGYAAGALAADLIFTVAAAPLIGRLGPVSVAATTCGLAVPMFAVLAISSGEISSWRAPTVPESAAIVFLGLILTAVSFLLWFSGLHQVGSARAGITIGVIPIAALTVSCVQAAAVPTAAQIGAVAAVTAGLALAASTKTWHLSWRWPAHRPAAAVLMLAVVASGCRPAPASVPVPEDPAGPVRQYVAALARGDASAAYELSRSSSRWLTGEGLACGYQPPTSLNIISTTFAARGDGNLAYIRAQYQLGGKRFESSLEVWKSSTDPPRWAIGSGATGRLDVISASSPHVLIANVEVTTPLSGPRVSGGTPSAGFFEVPPGVYTVRLASTAQSNEPVTVAVPAMAGDGIPVSVTIGPQPAAPDPPQRCAGTITSALPVSVAR